MTDDVKRRELSVDQVLEFQGFGLAQKLQLALVRVKYLIHLLRTFLTQQSLYFVLFFQCSVSWAIASAQVLLVLFTSLGAADPIRARLIECTKTGGEICEAALAEPYPAICHLPQDLWKFKSRGYSLVTEFNLVCDKSYWVHVAAAVFFIGCLLGAIIWHLADIAPRRLLHISAIIIGVSGALAATAPFFWTFMIFRGIAGIGVTGMMVSAFQLSIDLSAATWRPYAGLFLQAGFSAGALAATFLAVAVPLWRLSSILSLLPLLLTGSSWSALTESPQWLLMHGRKGEATAALASVAFTNQKRPPDHPLADPTLLLANPHRTIIDILRNARLRRLSTFLSFSWFAVTVAYYSGVMLTDALDSGDAAGDGTALQLALTGFLYELPGIAAAGLVAERLGRKYAVVGGLLESGGCLLGAGLTKGDAQRALAVASRFGIAAACTALYLITFEIYPVVVQYPGMTLNMYAARFGAVAAPALALAALLLRSALVPLSVSGALCLAAAVAMMVMLPETLGAPVHDTIQEMNSAGVKRHRSWTHSLRSVFRPPVTTPTGAVVLPAAVLLAGGESEADRNV